jgi:hypothetical protein
LFTLVMAMVIPFADIRRAEAQDHTSPFKGMVQAI